VKMSLLISRIHILEINKSSYTHRERERERERERDCSDNRDDFNRENWRKAKSSNTTDMTRRSVSFTHSQSRVTLLHPFINCVSQNPHWWHTFSNLTPKPAKLHTNSRPSTRFFLISQNTFLCNTHTNLKWKYDVLFQTQPIKTPVIHQSLSHTHVQTLFTENHTLMALEKAYKRSKVELFFRTVMLYSQNTYE